ncbi:protein ROS1-like [Senna tora]|uniref:Protein ROS1-like n=1 Tax=Senna tora TaxID=362788 RepID=A0A834TB73_9FABA|nr:protein ROS1-like [Senna tora]
MEVGESASAVTGIGSDGGGTCVKPSFDHLLAMADEAYLHFTAIHPPTQNPFIPIFESQSDPLPNPTTTLQEPQGANTGCFRKIISQFAPPRPDNSIRGEQPRDENPRENVNMHLGKGMVMEETQVAPSSSLSNINSLGSKPNANLIMNSKGKDLVTTQDGLEKAVKQSSQNDSNSSDSGNLTAQMGVPKRKSCATFEHADASCMNLIGSHYNDLHAYQTLLCVQFPNVRKKKRSEKGPPANTAATSSLSPAKDVRLATYPQVDASAHLYASSSKCLISCEYNSVEVPATFETTDGANHDKFQACESILSSQKRPTKRRSRAPSKFHDFAPRTTSWNCNIRPNHLTKQPSNSDRKTIEDAERPTTAIDALVAEMRASLTKKKRTSKKNTNTLVSSAHSSTNQMQLHHKSLLHSYHLSLAESLGATHQVTWKNMHMIDAQTEKFRHLVINREVRDNASHGQQNALVPYNQQNQNNKTPVHGNGTIITIDSSSQETQGANTGCYRKTISQFAPPKPDNSITGESRRVCTTDLLTLVDAASGHFTATHGEGVNMKTSDRLESAGSVMSIGTDDRGTCVLPNFEIFEKNMSFADLLALADSASGHFTATHLGTNYGVRNPFIPISKSLSHNSVSLEQNSISSLDCCPQQPQGTYTGCYSKAISQFAPPTPDKAIRGESRRVAGMQINVEEEKNIPSTKLDNKTPDKRELSEPVIGSSLAAVYTPLKNHKLDKGVRHCFDLSQPPSKESPTGRSAYMKRKGLDKASTTPRTKVTGESTEPVMPESIIKSSCGSLNFESGEQPTDENFALKEHVTMQLAPSTSICNDNSVGAKRNANVIKNSRRKDLVTKVGHEKTVTRSSQNDSNSSKLVNLMAGLQIGVTKRKHSAAIERADTSYMNLIGEHYNGLHAYQTMLWDQFPNVRKKRKGSLTNISSPGAKPNANFIRNSKGKDLVTTQDGHDKTITQTQSRPTIRRSRAPTRICDSAPLTTSRNCNILPNHLTKQRSNSQRKTSKDAKRPLLAINGLVAEMRALLKKKKKQPTKRNANTQVCSAHSSRGEMKMHHKFLLGGNHRSLAKSLGAAQKVTSKNRHNIKGEVRDIESQKQQNAPVPYKPENQNDNTYPRRWYYNYP